MSTKKKTAQGQTRTRVGKYELGRTLGEGSFAKVKFAKNVETGECVAIKILDRDQVLRHRMVEQVTFFPSLSISSTPCMHMATLKIAFNKRGSHVY